MQSTRSSENVVSPQHIPIVYQSIKTSIQSNKVVPLYTFENPFCKLLIYAAETEVWQYGLYDKITDRHWGSVIFLRFKI